VRGRFLSVRPQGDTDRVVAIGLPDIVKARSLASEPFGAAVMTKSELIDVLARKQSHLAYKDVELSVKTMLEHMSQALATGDRIEIRGFGSFSLHFRPPRVGRNPKTGETVSLPGKYVPHFKPGKELRERVNTREPAAQA
jgi:integration host factor subunit beta